MGPWLLFDWALDFFSAMNDGIMDQSPMGIEDERMMGYSLVKMGVWGVTVASCDLRLLNFHDCLIYCVYFTFYIFTDAMQNSNRFTITNILQTYWHNSLLHTRTCRVKNRSLQKY